MGMGKALIRKKKRPVRTIQWLAGGMSVLFVLVCYQNMSLTGTAPAMEQILNFLKEETAVSAWKNCMPVMLREETKGVVSVEEFLKDKMEEFYPVYSFSGTLTEYSTQIESDMTCSMLEENQQESQKEQKKSKTAKEEKEEKENKKEKKEQETAAKEHGIESKNGKAVEISREKLNDFDYLVQNFYQIDRTDRKSVV